MPDRSTDDELVVGGDGEADSVGWPGPLPGATLGVEGVTPYLHQAQSYGRLVVKEDSLN